MGHALLVIALVASQLAGVAGFVLSVYNYRQAKKAHQLALEAPKREAQRKYRADLRDVLHPAKRLSSQALLTLKQGGALVGDVPEPITAAKIRLEELIPVLKSPQQVDLYMLHLKLDVTEHTWRSHHWEQRRTAPDSDEQKRFYDAKRQLLRESIEELLPVIDKVVKKTVEEDNR